MKSVHQIWMILFSLSLFSGCELLQDPGGKDQRRTSRTIENFGGNWLFSMNEDSLAFKEKWDSVYIPHTFRLEPLVVNDQWQGVGYYRKNFEVQSLGEKKWFFHFEGVMQEAKVRVNDSLVAMHKGGYLPFHIDATPFLIEDTTNLLEVEVSNMDNSSIPPGKPLKELDFNFYGGIYRDVQLIKTDPLHITNAVYADQTNGGGVLVHFDEVSETKASGLIKTHIRNDAEVSREFDVLTELHSSSGKMHAFLSETITIKAGKDTTVVQHITIDEPELWSPAAPKLYQVVVELLEQEEVVDFQSFKTGIREIKLTAQHFFLNGKPVLLQGTNRHQEYPYIGYALSDEAHFRDAYKIKQAGFNFVRLSHYPQDPAFLKACDELGLLVMNAIPGWQYFEQGDFATHALKDIQDMVRRDRNHPSVVFWENSLNESPMPDEFMVEANKILRAELPYEDTYSAGWIDHPSYDLFIPARQHAKPPFYWNRYKKAERPILIAEYGDWEYYAQNAGFNQKAFLDLKADHRSSRQLRGAGEQRLLQQAFNFQEALNSNLKGKQTIGMANWLMFDYNRGYADNIEASGISDIFRIPKFSYYFYKSQKPPSYEPFSAPMVHIASYWTPESSEKVTIYSNTEEVALFLNNELIDRKAPERDSFSSALTYPPFYFKVPQFKAGELRAEAYVKGKKVASHSVRTPGPSNALELSVDYSGKEISEAAPDVVFVYAEVIDQNGNLVPSAENEVTFKLKTQNTDAVLIGDNPVKAEAGIATVLLRTNKFTGPVVIEAYSENLKNSQIILR